MSSVNLSEALNSPNYARRVWVDYYYKGNTYGVAAQDIGQIEAKWGSKIESWKNGVTDDITEYDIEDDLDPHIANGRKNAENASGYKDSVARSALHQANVASDAALALGSGATAMGVGANAISNSGLGESVMNGIGELGAKQAVKEGKDEITKASGDAFGKKLDELVGKKENVSNKAIKESKIAGDNAAKVKKGEIELEGKTNAKADAKKNMGAYITIALDVIAAAKYWITRPNKKQVEACMVYKENMETAQNMSLIKQEELQDMTNEINAANEDANLINEEAQQHIEDEKTKYDTYKETNNAIKDAHESGTKLSSDEKATFKDTAAGMKEAGENIAGLQEDAAAQLDDINSEIESYQSGYDATLEQIGETTGLTETAADIDTGTRNGAIIEAASQGLAGVSTGKAAYQVLMTPGWWNKAIAVVGFGAAASNAIAGIEQGKFVSDMNGELDVRAMTEETNAVTESNYVESVNFYNDALDDISNLEIEVPDDVEIPEEMELPEDVEEEENLNGNSDNPQDNNDDDIYNRWRV